jgi:peptidoglycan lytic transglycosylase
MPSTWLRRLPKALAVLALVALVACGTAPRGPRSGAPASGRDGPGPNPPPNLAQVPDAEPRLEPFRSGGPNKPYEVFGRSYTPLAGDAPLSERGLASWYGRKFHGRPTSSGEPYDMYAMTAAHKTLPLPCYAEVTNLRNGRSIVVRINDRGPFVANRLIDLSYVAAAKLDMLREGTTLVEVRTLNAPETPLPAPVVAQSDLYIAAGAFAEESNATRLLSTLRAAGIGPVFIREATVNERHLFRVRVGPVPDVAEFDRLVDELRGVGIPDARLALD